MVQLVCFAVELPSKLVLLTQTAEASQDLLVLLKLEHRNAIVWRRAGPDSLARDHPPAEPRAPGTGTHGHADTTPELSFAPQSEVNTSESAGWGR